MKRFGLWFLLILLGLSPAFAESSREVVVYCALDQPYAESIFRMFEKSTGIRVKALYDSEAVKTVGLVNRLIAEKARPQCDVFWNNEKLRTVILAQKGLLEPYEPKSWEDRKLPHDSKNKLWSEFAARARVIVFHRDTPPKKLLEASTEGDALISPENKGKVAFAYPLFGTTSTQFLCWLNEERNAGRDPLKWLQKVAENKPILCQGNSDVVRKIVRGEAQWGYTDSDDVLAAQQRGEPVDFYLGASKSMSPLLIPNTVGLIRGAPHRAEAEAFINFLLSEGAEIALAQGVSSQIPLGKLVQQMTWNSPFLTLMIGKGRSANEEQLVQTMESDFQLLRQVFHR
jgi:iron(III) transport system substrate-binding protein